MADRSLMQRTRKTEPSVESKFRAAELSSAFAQRTSHRLILGDAREMTDVTNPVHLVVTSPPYWTLKEYDGAVGDGQLGHLEDYERFHDELDRVWKRCFDV